MEEGLHRFETMVATLILCPPGSPTEKLDYTRKCTPFSNLCTVLEDLVFLGIYRKNLIPRFLKVRNGFRPSQAMACLSMLLLLLFICSGGLQEDKTRQSVAKPWRHGAFLCHSHS